MVLNLSIITDLRKVKTITVIAVLLLLLLSLLLFMMMIMMCEFGIWPFNFMKNCHELKTAFYSLIITTAMSRVLKLAFVLVVYFSSS